MIDFTCNDYVATITINRPAKKNALTHEMWRALRDLVVHASNVADARILILTGAGNNFCAGADIGEFGTVRDNPQTATDYERDNCGAFNAIRDCPIPTIAAIQGVCFGGGFGIAAACDLRFGDESAQFCVPPAKLGLAYPVDAMCDIVNAIGPQQAKMLAYSAKVIDAKAAHSCGFILDVFTTDDFEHHVSEIAKTIAANAPLSNRATKASVNAVLNSDPAVRNVAIKLGNATFKSSDYAEGRAAFKEKRKPVFRGD